MKVLAPAALLVGATVLLTFAALSFVLFPRPLSLGNPTLLIEVVGGCGAVLFAMGARGLYRLHRQLLGKMRMAPDATAAA